MASLGYNASIIISYCDVMIWKRLSHLRTFLVIYLLFFFFPISIFVGWGGGGGGGGTYHRWFFAKKLRAMRIPDFIFVSLNNLRNKHSECMWFETLYCPCDAINCLHFIYSYHFHPRPVLAFGYCRCLCLCVRPSARVSITSLSAW